MLLGSALLQIYLSGIRNAKLDEFPFMNEESCKVL